MRIVLRDALAVGLSVSGAGMLGTAWVLCYLDLPLRYYSAAAALPLLCGCFAAGFSAGRRLRQGGWRCGAFAALLLTAFWYAAACALRGALQSPMLLLTALPGGMCGGVFGVNTPLPEPHRRLHRAERLRQKLRFYPALLHRPRQDEGVTPTRSSRSASVSDQTAHG